MDPKTCSPAATHWRTDCVPQEIKRLLIARNQKHFGQAEGTPFTQPAIRTELHYDGSGQVGDLILQGTYEAEYLSTATQLFVKHLKKKSDTILSGEITAKEFVAKIKRWPEKTSTSPSGFHLGHFHVLWRHHGLDPEDPKKAAVESGQQFLIGAHVILLNYAMKFGYSYTRWQDVVNVMLMKEPGNPKIHRLRVIHLYEADYNLLLAVKWRQAMHHAEDKGYLNEGLYGSRAGRSVHIYLTSMKVGINYDLDATSCYDRILAAIASITSRCMDMNKHVVLVNAKTLQAAKFKLKTSLGISDAFYQHCRIYPIHGTGQGLGNSPQIWCFVSCSILFDALQSTTDGSTFVSYNERDSITLHMNQQFQSRPSTHRGGPVRQDASRGSNLERSPVCLGRGVRNLQVFFPSVVLRPGLQRNPHSPNGHHRTQYLYHERTGPVPSEAEMQPPQSQNFGVPR
jgi:hypothetical protein